MPLRIGMVAGESSGDRLGAGLLEALRRLDPAIEAEGIAGPRMSEAGCRCIAPMERLAVMGILEVLARYRELRRLRARMIEEWLERPPDAFIGIDAPDFNLGLEQHLKAAGIRTIHYVSPQLWAWRPGRVHGVARAADLVLTLFPFETDVYRRHGVDARFVGHPLADEIPLTADRAAARDALGLPRSGPVLALLPGSRATEIVQHLAPFLETASLCARALPELCCAIAAVDAAAEREILAGSARYRERLRLAIYRGRAHQVLAAADAALLACGTAALEAMLHKRPMVVGYRMAALTYVLLRPMVRGPRYAMPNILAGRELVPEFIQWRMQPGPMSERLLPWLTGADSATTIEQVFTDLHRRLRCGASDRAAAAVLELLRAAPGREHASARGLS
jgi:lipid-A-disaccharide synthase